MDPLKEEDDTGVEVALWGESCNYLYTGGSDGIIKIWDVKRGDPFIRDLGSVDSQIMSAAFSPGQDMLLVGDSEGVATLFSVRGDENQEPGEFQIVGPALASDDE